MTVDIYLLVSWNNEIIFIGIIYYLTKNCDFSDLKFLHEFPDDSYFPFSHY